MKSDLEKSPRRRPLLRDLPSWFRLDNYWRVDGLDALDWYGQITVRQVCFRQLRDMRDPDPIFAEWHGPVQQALASLREDPICNPAQSPFFNEAFAFCWNIGFPKVPVVRSMTLWDVYRADGKARGKLTQYQIDQAQRIASDPFLRAYSYLGYQCPEWMNARVEDECFVAGVIPLIIDLSFPNSMLRKHFEIHLQRLRRHRKGKPGDAGRQSPSLKEWAEVGLLPCMDLLLWAEEQEGRVPSSLMADALGSKGNMDEEKVRKTLRPLATGLLIPDSDGLVTLTRLRALAYADWFQRQQAQKRLHWPKS